MTKIARLATLALLSGLLAGCSRDEPQEVLGTV